MLPRDPHPEATHVARWLLKTEPDEYSFGDLAKAKKAVWDGVGNALALKHIRSMTKGDEVVIYHTGDEKSAVGLATVASAPYADPTGDDPKLAVVDLRAGKPLARPVTLAQIKADPAFAGWDLLRIGRLSVVPVPDAMWDRLLALSEGKD
jgi:predicted RNA-binding protein with PUA-like domain